MSSEPDTHLESGQPAGAPPQGGRRSVSTGSPYEPTIGFSRAVRIGDVVAVSGTAPLGPDGRTVGRNDPAAQAARCFEIAKAALEGLGARLEDVIRTRMFLTRIEDWPAVGEAHGRFFGSIRPASTMVQIAKLIDPEWLVEIEVDAVVGDPRAPGC